jgi:serine/threonine-protein kinase PknG
VQTLESVPESSIHYTAARVAAVRARLRQRLPVGPAGAPAGTAAGPGAPGMTGMPGPAGTPHGAPAAGADASFLADLTAAADQVEALDAFGLDAVRRELLATEVLGTALDWVLSGNHGAAPPHGGGRTVLLGSELDERGLRFGLERSYRTLARLANSGKERIELVERANRLRPRTWV